MALSGTVKFCLEDFEDDIEADHIEDINQIVQLAKEVEVLLQILLNS